jgi:hypothetical protein
MIGLGAEIVLTSSKGKSPLEKFSPVRARR